MQIISAIDAELLLFQLPAPLRLLETIKIRINKQTGSAITDKYKNDTAIIMLVAIMEEV